MTRCSAYFLGAVWFLAGGVAAVSVAWLFALEPVRSIRLTKRIERDANKRVRELLQARDQRVNRASDLYQENQVLGDESVARIVGRLRD